MLAVGAYPPVIVALLFAGPPVAGLGVYGVARVLSGVRRRRAAVTAAAPPRAARLAQVPVRAVEREARHAFDTDP